MARRKKVGDVYRFDFDEKFHCYCQILEANDVAFFRQNNMNPIYWPFTNIDSSNYGINSVNRYWKGRLDTGRRDV